MKISPHRQYFKWRVLAAFTLVEMMVTMAIFTFVILALVYSHIFGLRYDQVVGSKLGASDQSRMAFGKMLNEIRSAKSYQIGTTSGTNFIPDSNGTNQIGDALKICTTTNTSNYIRYYLDSTSQELRRIETGVSGYDVTAQYLTNTTIYATNKPIFTSEDFAGNIVTTNNYKYLIHIVMQFYMYKYPKTSVGPGSYYDFYKLEFKAAPRAP